jgi:L-fucose mutarotase
MLADDCNVPNWILPLSHIFHLFMLKGISPLLTADLLKILMEMGHGDEIVLADANFPAASHARNLVHCAGSGVPELLEAVLALFPLDSYVSEPVSLMDLVPGDSYQPTIWATYRGIVDRIQPDAGIAKLERYAFYERARAAYAIVATSETALYANVILKKGVVRVE